jgi:hypothetical protein
MVPIQHIRGIGAVLAGLARCLGALRRHARVRPQTPGGRRTWKRIRGAGLGRYHRRRALGWQISLIAVGTAVRVLRTGTPVHVLPYLGRWDVLSQAPNVVQPHW